MNAILNYIRGSVEELHQVRWPTRQQAVRLTIIVLIFILISSVIVGVVDAFLAQIIRLILA